MGQYYVIVNPVKREWLRPATFGDGPKLLEFGASGSGTMLALAVLLSNGGDEGGGDLHTESPMLGHWAGDPVVVAGDYGPPGHLVPTEDATPEPGEQKPPTLYRVARAKYRDISPDVIRAMCDDSFTAGQLAQCGVSPDLLEPYALGLGLGAAL